MKLVWQPRPFTQLLRWEKGLELCLYLFRPFPQELRGTILNVYSLRCSLANSAGKKLPVVD